MMKKLILMLLMVVCFACAEDSKSPTETAQIVVESFYGKDFPTLEQYTTAESFGAFMSINDIVPVAETRDSEFKVLQETENGEIAWVRFTTVYEEEPEVFKLIQEDGRWKVTEIGLEEKGPF